MSETLGEYMKALRLQRKLTLEQLAGMAQVSARTLIRWEQDKTCPRLPELESVLSSAQATAAQRRHAIGLADAPRAARLLRQESEETHLGAAPMSGDLLRAMRLRRGKTLEDMAREVGVGASVISRWERSEIWPETEHLHRLSYALGARAEEVSALTRRRFAPEASVQGDAAEDARQGAELFLNAPVTLEGLALRDLQFYSVVAPLWAAQRRTEFRLLLGEIYTHHADFLFGQNRFAECERIGMQALDFLSGGRNQVEYITLATLRAAEAAETRGGRRGALRAESLLRDTLPLATDAYRKIWIFCNLGQAQNRLGRREEAKRLADDALRLLPPAYTNWQSREGFDQVIRLLTDAGYFKEALDVIARFDAIRRHPSDAIRMAKLLFAQAQPDAANHWLQRAYQLLDDPAYNATEQALYAAHFRRKADLLGLHF